MVFSLVFPSIAIFPVKYPNPEWNITLLFATYKKKAGYLLLDVCCFRSWETLPNKQAVLIPTLLDISGCDNPSAASTSALFLIWYSEFLRFKATKNKPANAFFQYVVFDQMDSLAQIGQWRYKNKRKKRTMQVIILHPITQSLWKLAQVFCYYHLNFKYLHNIVKIINIFASVR